MKRYEKMGLSTEDALKWIGECQNRLCKDCPARGLNEAYSTALCASSYLLSAVPEQSKVPRVAHTKADEIRAMNDEELANFLCNTSGMCAGCIAADFCKYGKIGFVEWLKLEVQSDT